MLKRFLCLLQVYFDLILPTKLFHLDLKTVELVLFIMPELPETGISVDPSFDLVAKKMTNLEKLSVHFSPEASGYDININDVDFILPLLNGLQNCQSLHQLEISCNPHVRIDVDYFDILSTLLQPTIHFWMVSKHFMFEVFKSRSKMN